MTSSESTAPICAGASWIRCGAGWAISGRVHSPDSAGQPVVPTEGCRGAVVVIRHPADVAVSLSHFFSWDLERCGAFLLNEEAALCRSSKRGGQQVRQFMGSWASHVQSWVDQQQIPVLLLRY